MPTNDDEMTMTRRRLAEAVPRSQVPDDRPFGRRLIASSIPLALGFAALAVVVLVDRVGLDADLLPHAVLDELSHLLTGYIGLVVARAWGAPVVWPAVLIGSVAPDIDHVPVLLGWVGTPDGTTRPVTHALLTVVALLVIAGIDRRRRAIWASAAFGVGLHLFRDLGTGAVLLWWPASDAPVSIPYATYIALSAAGLGSAIAPIVGVAQRTMRSQPAGAAAAPGSGNPFGR